MEKIEIKVDLILEDQTRQLLSGLLKALDAAEKKIALSQPQTEAPAKEEPAKPTDAATPQTAKTTEEEPMDVPTRVRRIIDRTRRRLFGDDYEVSDDYRDCRRQFNEQLRKIANAYGAEKPTLLGEGFVDVFERECGDLVYKDGEVSIPVKF